LHALYQWVRLKNLRTGINGCSQVIDVGDEQVFVALIQELLQLTGIVQRIEDVSVAGRVPEGRKKKKKVTKNKSETQEQNAISAKYTCHWFLFLSD
jgi:hypothetical protein